MQLRRADRAFPAVRGRLVLGEGSHLVRGGKGVVLGALGRCLGGTGHIGIRSCLPPAERPDVSGVSSDRQRGAIFGLTAASAVTNVMATCVFSEATVARAGTIRVFPRELKFLLSSSSRTTR